MNKGGEGPTHKNVVNITNHLASIQENGLGGGQPQVDILQAHICVGKDRREG